MDQNKEQQESDSKSKSISTSENGLLNASVMMAFQRVGFDINEVMSVSIVTDIRKHYKGQMTDDEIVDAIRNGAFGKYGKTYRMSAQEVFMWLKKHEDYLYPPMVY